ncbi:peptidoglycan DD-metalloendopeptidase family protein [Niabella yanshanensis]|uniref:Peptidoglycan DD-metalloendopeptidase family protein n=1 Tax=Niabella yanshanensis TaxID=577386 RepID=A0ABZ0W7S3_9BACT|nr:peptidoglycan DD-metalloendopeptidase family protein [Niabella yanshanensis]WQD37577.1 peptidoglycan DD-metalloendopeptidase family protein [Niabella yanshanensis]
MVGSAFACNQAVAQKTSDKTAMEEERRKLQQELRQIQQAYDAVKGESRNNLHQLAALNKKIEVQNQYINNIGKEIRLIDDDIYYSAIEIKRLKKQMDTLKVHYARTVVYAYKNRSNYDYLNFIFSANSFNDAIKRVAYLKSYRNYREKQMEDIVKTNSLIDKRYAHQVASKKQKEGALASRTNEYSVLDNQRTEKDSVAKLLQSQAGSLQKQIAKKQQEDKQLKSDIAAVVRREIAEAKKIAQEDARLRAAAEAQERQEAWARERLLETEKALAGATPTTISPGAVPVAPPPAQEVASAPSRELKFDPVGAGKTTTVRAVPKSDNSIVANTGPITVRKNTPPPPAPVVENKAPAGGYLNYKADDIALNSDFSQNRGKLPSPVDGVITLGFGRYKIEGVGPDIVGDNPGVTYTAQVGAPVRAVFGGEVVSVSKVGGTSFVVLRHGKYFTAYSNLASVAVSKGAAVARGQAIGTVGADEETSGGKLDFILMIEEKNVDPRAWLR